MTSLVRIPAPTGGFDDSVAPAALGKDQAAELQNFLVHRPGKLVIRGPLGGYTELFSSDTPLRGVWVHGEKLLFGATPSTTTMKFVDMADLPSGVVDVTLADVDHAIIGQSARIGDYAYGRPPADCLLRWNGTSATAPAPMTDAPVAPTDLCVHLGRLFVAGGAKPGTVTPFLSNRLWWTDIGGPDANTLADWKDDVSGLVNELAVGDDGDAIVRVVSMRTRMLVFKSNSIWEVRGSAPSQFEVRQITSSIGCYDTLGSYFSKTTQVFDDVCVFLTRDGWMHYDGVSFTRMTAPGVGLEEAAASPSPTAVRLRNDYIAFTGGSGTVIDLLYQPRMAWTRLVATGTLPDWDNHFWAVSTETGTPVLYEGGGIRSLANLTADELPPAVSAGVEYERDGFTQVSIMPRVTSRPIELAMPGSRAVVRRIFLDHRLVGSPAGAEWFIDMLGYDGNTILPAGATPSLTFSGAGLSTTAPRVREVRDVYAETDDLAVDVIYQPTGSPPELEAAEIHDVWIEFELAQQR